MPKRLTAEQKLFKAIYGKPTTVEIINSVKSSNLAKDIKQELTERLEKWAEENV